MAKTWPQAAWLALCGVILLLASPLAAATTCTDTVDTTSPVLSNGFAFNLSNTRDNPSQITSTNVAGLALAVSNAATGGVKEKRGAPAVTQQAVFFSDGLQIVAMNRLSGCIYWTHTIPYWTTPLVGSNAVRSSAVYYLNEGAPNPALVLAGDYYGNFYAVEVTTGKLVWSRFVGADRQQNFITGAPQFFDGKLFVPIASKQVLSNVFEPEDICCTSHGMVVAIDPYTGATLWSYQTAPDATYDATERKYAPNGASVWGTPAVDPVRHTLYIGTGQNYTPPTTDHSDSIIALDTDTGTEKWVFQATAGDAYNVSCYFTGDPLLDRNCVPPVGWDFDFGAPPILVQLSTGQEAVIAGAKNGVVYSLDPDTGALNWQRRVGAGGTLGGVHWGMAADATRVYAAVSDATTDKASALAGAKLLGITSAITQVPNATPGLYALDLLSGTVIWYVRPQHVYQGASYDSIYSAALSLSNDVLFAGSLDGTIKAFRTSDGTELWSYDTAQDYTDSNGNKGNGGTIDSVGGVPAGGDLLVNSGYDTFGDSNALQAGPGNMLLVFRLPGS
jgi:polyvinyl alcohol dehydrogenase (cytochrome)